MYLLGWYDENGRPYLTTWDGPAPLVGVVVTGVHPIQMPLWSAPVPSGAKLHPVPREAVTVEQRIAHAKTLGGYYAFGWVLELPIERKSKEQRQADAAARG